MCTCKYLVMGSQILSWQYTTRQTRQGKKKFRQMSLWHWSLVYCLSTYTLIWTGRIVDWQTWSSHHLSRNLPQCCQSCCFSAGFKSRPVESLEHLSNAACLSLFVDDHCWQILQLVSGFFLCFELALWCTGPRPLQHILLWGGPTFCMLVLLRTLSWL